MISTKYRKEQKKRAEEIMAAKRAAKDPQKKDKIKGNKKDHRVRMQTRNERIRQRGLFRIAERKRKIEELKAIIEENRKKKLEEEAIANGEVNQENDINDVYNGLLELGNTPTEEIAQEEE